jgi:hypothetical protein
MTQEQDGGMPDMASLNAMIGDMTRSLEHLQARAAEIQRDGQAGGGMVAAVANGEQEILRVSIDPRAMADRELLEDLVTVAVNDALRKAREALSSQMNEMAAFHLPSLGG